MSDSAVKTPDFTSGDSSLRRAAFKHHRIGMIGVVLLHFAIVGGLAVLALTTQRAQLPPRFSPPFLMTAIALLMGECSLVGIWLVRCQWPSYIKAIVAVCAAAGLSALLLAMLENGAEPSRAAGWGASFATQLLVAALLTAAIRSALSQSLLPFSRRFSILFLLIWTAVVGAIMAGWRWLCFQFGWTMENFAAWEYFVQLQVIAMANAVMAVSAMMCANGSAAILTRCLRCTIAIFMVAAATAATMFIAFAQVGASLSELVWLSVVQGGLVAVTFLPCETSLALSKSTHISK